jgi:hypothetical protein
MLNNLNNTLNIVFEPNSEISENSKVLRIIFTQEEKKIVRKNISNFRQSYVIDTRELILEYDYQPGIKISTPMDFIIQQEIEKKLKQAITNKKAKQVIYFHYNINAFLIKNIRDFFRLHKAEFEFVLFDSNKSLFELHDLFDEIITIKI